jgi:hypothetical protein
MYLLKPGLAGAVLALAAVPAQAQIDNRDPGRFVQSIAQTGFGSLKGPRSAARGKFARSWLSISRSMRSATA